MKLRFAAIAVAIPVVSAAGAQNFLGTVQAGIKELRDRELLPLPVQTNPTQPTGLPLPPPKREGDLPRPGPLGPEGGGLQVIQSGHVASESGGAYIHVTGGVEFTDRGYHCWADEMYGDRRTDTYTLKGHVKVLGEQESVYGDLVQVDFTNRKFVAEDSESTLKPPLLRGFFRDNLYVKAHKSYGSEREVFGETTASTTCSYPDPHYEIVAEKTDLRPGRRVIFRKVKIKLLGHTILNLPFLSIPLDERTYNNLPQVGHDQIAGYWIKNRFGVPINDNLSANLRFDYFTKLGTGLGSDFQYSTPEMRGNLRLYTILGPHQEFEVAGQHRQTFRWGTLTLDNAFEDSNYLISQSTKTLNTRAVLLVPQGTASSRVSYFRSSSDSPGGNSLQQTISLNDSRPWNRRLTTNLDVNLSNNNSSFTGGNATHREQVDIAFRAVDDLERAQARLDYIRSIPIGESANFFNTSDITPALTLLSDSRRLLGPKGDTRLPFQTELSFGEYGDPIKKGRLTRANFDLAFQNPRRSTSRHWNLAYQGEFKQSVYSNDTAQYVLRGGTQLTYNFRNSSRFNIRYDYLRPYGYAPLQIDRRGKTNLIQSDLSYSPFKGMLIGAATGYDFNLVPQHAPTAWQQVGLRAQYKIERQLDIRTLSTYDTRRHAFSSTRFDLTWLPGSTYVSFGAKYDGIRNKWAAANLYIDGFQWGRLRTSMLLNYNGYLKRFEAEHFSFIYDLHCAEAVLQILDNQTGFNSGRTVYFFIRIKALPFDTPFGTGQRGQPIGTGTGRDF